MPIAKCVSYSTFLVFDIGGYSTPAAFKLEPIVAKNNGWKLLLLLQKIPSYML